jgi:hypothetical protein
LSISWFATNVVLDRFTLSNMHNMALKNVFDKEVKDTLMTAAALAEVRRHKI